MNKANFNFSLFKKYNNTVTTSFLEWFVGFTEGDGSFIVNSRGNVTFVVTQHSKNKYILNNIRDQLGFGNVIRQGITINRFVVNKKADIYKLILLFNGNIILPSKKKTFSLWVRQYNKMNQENVNVLSQNPLPSKENAWLAGFTDAEGCFTCSLLGNCSSYRYRYLLAQKGVENKVILDSIQCFLGGKVSSMHMKDMYQLTVNGCKNAKKVMEYFDKYSLQTSKKKSYDIWKSVYDDLQNKKHMNTFTRDILKKKVISMNH